VSVAGKRRVLAGVQLEGLLAVIDQVARLARSGR